MAVLGNAERILIESEIRIMRRRRDAYEEVLVAAIRATNNNEIERLAISLARIEQSLSNLEEKYGSTIWTF